jgi:hypothetical protein
MTGNVMRKLADALGEVGFVIKDIRDEEYGQYQMPASGEKYTGLLFLKIRPAEDENADIEKARLRKEAEKAAAKPAEAVAKTEEVPF